MELIERWWNGSWGRLTRRDVWLRSDGTRWRVEARQGDGDARIWARDYATEGEARETLAGLLARGATQWRQLT